MARSTFIISALGVVALATSSGIARAQQATVAEIVTEDSFDANSLALYEGRGYAISRDLIMHTSVQLDGGATDNVFYQSSSQTGSGLMRLAASFHVVTVKDTPEDLGDSDSDTSAELTPRRYEFRGGVTAGYLRYLSGNDAVTSQSDWTVHALADLDLFPASTASLIVRDRYLRDVRSPTFEDSFTLARDDNDAYLGVRGTSGALAGTLYGESWISAFEGGQPSEFANRLNNTIGLTVDWHWFPMTKISGDVSYGFFGPLGTSTAFGMSIKSTSQPLRSTVGLATLLGSQTTLKAHAGYSHASYSMGEGYSAPVGGLELGYRWTDQGRVLFLYDYDHFDSVNANFYRDHLFSAQAVQQLGPLVLDGGLELRLRHFGGISPLIGAPDRDDVVTALLARVQLMRAERYTLSAEYRLENVKTDYRANTLDGMGNVIGTYDPSFLRNEVWLGLQVAY
jgi:hypothetical protein